MARRILAALMAAILLLLCVCRAEEEEIYPTCEFDLDAYGGMLNVAYGDGSADETGGWGFSTDLTEEGMTIGDILKDFDIASIEVVNEGEVFEGWLVFDVEVTEDEDGFSEYSYSLKSEAPVTTEELLALPAQEGYTAYAAKWESMSAGEYYQYEDSGYEETIRIPSVTLYSGEGVLLMDGEEEDYESGLNVASVEPGQTVGEALELDRLLSVSCDGAEFAGWTVYDVAWMETIEGMPEDESLPHFEVFNGWYCVLYDYIVIGEGMSTEEIGELVCGEGDLLIWAGWK